MSTGVSIEGHRESGKDVRDDNGKPHLNQCVQPYPSPTSFAPHSDRKD